MKNILKIYRCLLILGALAFLVWLLHKNIIVQGQLFLTKDFCFPSRFISDLYPEERVGDVEEDDAGNCFQRIFVEPVYFKVKVPRTFARAKVKITYANPQQPIFQFGLMKKKEYPLDWRFSLRLLENKIFDDLSWHRLTEQDVSLWQKKKRFENIYEFVNDVPDDQKTVTFFYQFSPEAVKDKTKVVEWNAETNLNYVDYIIARYQSPEVVASRALTQEVWQENEVEFFAGDEHMNDHSLEFIVSAPGLTNNRYEVKIRKIEVELSRTPTDWSTFFIDINNYFLKKLRNVREKLQ